MLPFARIAAVVLLTLPVVARAQPQGPFTSGGNLPYIASGQSEEDILRKKRAKAEAEAAKARQDAEDKAKQDATKQDAAKPAEPPPAVEPAKVEPAKVAAPKPEPAPRPAEPEVVVKPEAPAKAPKAERPAASEGSDIARSEPPKLKVVRPRPPDNLPPGVLMDNQQIGSMQPRPPAAVLVRPRESVIVVERPMFFGLFGPRVPVRERVVELVPPGTINRAPPPPQGSRFASGQKGRMPGSNCHYHAYPEPGLPYHRDVQCHWHQNPTDPAIRYVE